MSFLLCLIALLSTAAAFPRFDRIVDMTHVYDETTQYDPSHRKFEMTITSYGYTDKGFWLQNEEYASGSHVGTHIDAPRHFTPVGMSVDQLSPYKLIAPAAVVDITQKAAADPDYRATVQDLFGWESRTGQSLNGTIVLLRTGWGEKWTDTTAFFGRDQTGQMHFPGLSAEAAQWLVDYRDINAVGIGTLSIDGGNTVNNPCHQILLTSGHFALENVANIDKIPISGAKLYVMPMKMGGASGASVRIMAIFPEVVFQ